MKKNYIGLFFIVSFVFCRAEIVYFDKAVIGAGPAGIATIGKTLDYLGDKKESIVWIDPEFAGGRIAKWYGSVHSNTKVDLFLRYFNMSDSFGFSDESKKKFPLFSCDSDKRCFLALIKEPLLFATKNLQKKVTIKQDYVREMWRDCCWWGMQLGNDIVYAKKVILATGSHPRVLPYEGPDLIPLDIALDPAKLKNYVNEHDEVAVFGNAHSGILVMKALYELGVKRIVNFYKSPPLYAVELGSRYIFDNTGLKGIEADWARQFYEDTRFSVLEKHYSSHEEINRILPTCTKVIYAVGYEQNLINGLCPDMFKEYNADTSRIGQGLYGLGIAFPERVLDLSGRYEHNVGIFDFINFACRAVELWCNDYN